jgi:acyl-CoA reductase-like NAD-dependent aldehyde dehydrogenase
MNVEASNVLISYNPANGEVVGEVPITDPAEIPGIVEGARASAASWRAMSLEERGAALKKAGERLVERADSLGEQLSREMGKPLGRGIGEVRSCGKSMAGKVERAIAALSASSERNDKVETTLHRDPLGVCGVISPWNYPMSMPHWMVVPALMAGNAVVLKPSEETPLTAQAYAEVLAEFLPAGVLRVVHGADAQGKALVDADVNLIAFTGSRSAGIHIMRAAAGGLKRLVLELGGKDPLIVLDDADVEAAAKFAVGNSFDNSGQMCVSTERIFVHESIGDAFEKRLSDLAAEYKHGPWDAEGVKIGPMIHERQRAHVLGHIEDAIEKGATATVGGASAPDRFVLPTVLTGVREDMKIASEETFGPVACVTRFTDVEEALQVANASVYGLGAVVFGRDEERAHGVARRLDAGMIGVNKSIFGVGDTPWVGAKQSGFGYHGSADGYRQFAQTRVVSRPLG